MRTARLIACAILAVAGSAVAGPPFVTDDPEPPDLGRWEVNYGLTGTAMAGGGAAALPQIDANYGALPDLQLHVQPQFSYVVDGSARHAGIGDTEIGAKYRFVEETGSTPMIALFPRFEIPTGAKSRELGAGNGRAFLPIWAQKTIGRWTVYGGGGYWIDPGAQGKNAWFAGAVALYQVTDTLQLGGEAFLATAMAPGGKDAPGFNFGGTYALAEDYAILFSAGRGLANADDANRFSAYLALQVIY